MPRLRHNPYRRAQGRKREDSALQVEAFRQALSESGYVEGKDATMDYERLT